MKTSTCCNAKINEFERCSECKEVNEGEDLDVVSEDTQTEDEYIQQMSDRFGG